MLNYGNAYELDHGEIDKCLQRDTHACAYVRSFVSVMHHRCYTFHHHIPIILCSKKGEKVHSCMYSHIYGCINYESKKNTTFRLCYLPTIHSNANYILMVLYMLGVKE